MADEKQQTEELQRKYLEFHLLTQQIEKFREQLQQLDQQLMELDSVRDSLEELKEVKEGRDMFVPLASGVFVKGRTARPDMVVLNVGASVAVEKPIPEAQELIGHQMEAAAQIKEQMMANLRKLTERAREVQKELEKLVE